MQTDLLFFVRLKVPSDSGSQYSRSKCSSWSIFAGWKKKKTEPSLESGHQRLLISVCKARWFTYEAGIRIWTFIRWSCRRRTCYQQRRDAKHLCIFDAIRECGSVHMNLAGNIETDICRNDVTNSKCYATSQMQRLCSCMWRHWLLDDISESTTANDVEV